MVINWRDTSRTIDCVTRLCADDAVDEVLVVDNESSKRTREALEAINQGRLSVIPVAENRGYAAGVNVALDALRQREVAPRNVLLVNNDLVAEGGAVAALIDHLDESPSCGIVGPIIYHYPSGQLDSIQSAGGVLRPWRGTVSQRTSAAGFSDVGYVTFACALLRYDAIISVGAFDEKYFMYWEDVDLCQRVRNVGWSLDIEPRARAWHELSASSERAGSLLLTYGTWAACTFASSYGLPWPATVRVRAVLSAARRLVKGRRGEARALLRGLSMPRDPRRPAYIVRADLVEA